jgi:hypothetical protein
MKRIAVLLFLTACGGSSNKAPPEPAKPLVWKDMNADQRQTYMKDVVLPKAKEIFVAFDPKYSTMDCVTCHGDGAADGSFEMPNAKIKPLPNSEEAFIAWVSKDPEAGRYAGFMAEKVEPLMADLLNEKPFDPKTKTGEFGCTACHTLIGPDGKVIAPEHHDHDHDHDHDHH